VETILLVDDSPIDRTLAARLLTGQGGYDVVEAESGEEALALLQDNSPRLLITDIQMPGMNGLDLLRKVSQLQPDLPVMLVTARGSEEIAVQAIQAGAASYVPKARLADELVPTVQRILARRREDSLEITLQEFQTVSVSEFQFPNDVEVLVNAAAHMARKLERAWQYPVQEVLRIRMTLEEAFLNALYHGNLRLDRKLREVDLNRYHDMAQSRATQYPYSSRRIHVRHRMQRNESTWEIHDEGPGFYFARYLEADEASALNRAYGRGIVLMRTVMDEVEFSDGGRAVKLTVRNDPDRPATTETPSAADAVS
jgi:CheY-like chemotaxis protein/anti-sigma regulatory factor (Ser/Thr protein kinase)